MYDIIIIGAGTAGMSAGIYGARAGKKVLLLESKSYGGQIIYSSQVDNYPGIKSISGFEFATGLYEQVKELDVEILFEEVRDIEEVVEIEISNKEGMKTSEIPLKKVITSKGEYITKTIIVATGTTNRTLGIPSEDKYLGKGISYCATCDGAFFRNKPVAVVGGGNTALEEAIYLADFCSHVYLIHRREELRGEKALQEKAQANSKITLILNSEVVELKGDSVISSIIINNNEIDETKEIEVNGVFVAIGKLPDTKLVSNLVECTEYGYINAGEDCKTNIAGIYVAGDCREKALRQLTTAASDGAVAAMAACEVI